MTDKRSISKGAITAVLFTAVAITALLAWKMNGEPILRPPEDIEDYLFWEAKELAPFTLMGAKENQLELNGIKEKWSFLFFGYTHCPDVCPVTLGMMGMTFKHLERIPSIAPLIQGVFISVDPRRDTPALLKEYVTYFNPNFIGVTGNTAQIDNITRQIGALYTLHDEESKEEYLVSHNSTIFLIDPRGRLYGRFPPPHNPKEMASAFTAILKFYNAQEERRWSIF